MRPLWIPQGMQYRRSASTDPGTAPGALGCQVAHLGAGTSGSVSAGGSQPDSETGSTAKVRSPVNLFLLITTLVWRSTPLPLGLGRAAGGGRGRGGRAGARGAGRGGGGE